MKFDKFGSNVPFAEPPWYRGIPTPYYDQSHVEFRKRIRDYVDKHLLPNVDEWEERCAQRGEEVDYRKLNLAAAKEGVLAPMYPKEIGGTPLPGGVKFDAFHDLIWIDELARTGASGLIACLTIYTMALPPVLKHASQEIKDRVVGPVLRGEKTIALCITEPTAGSDMAGMSTTAEKTPDGKYYIVSGVKKWVSFVCLFVRSFLCVYGDGPD
jgi:alkylation response protein AidB-like acyl-CoA dehydrogenase